MICQICRDNVPDELINDGLCPICHCDVDEPAEDWMSSRYLRRKIKRQRLTEREDLNNGIAI